MNDEVRGTATRAVVLTAVGLAVVQLGLRAWVAFGGFFNLDDYVFYTRAGESALTDWNFLLQDYNGHLMPGSLVWVWLSTDLAPLEFGPVVVVSLILQAAIDGAMFLVLRRLFGMRWAVLVPFTVFLFATLSLPGMVWWAAALNQLPQQLFMLLAILGHLRYVRTERTRDALLAPLALLGGLAFSEKTVLALPLLLLITWWFFVGPINLRGISDTLVRYRTTWLAQGGLVIGYLVYYATQVDSPVRGGLSGGDVASTFDMAVRRTVLPGILGGPWRWKPLGVVDSLADPHPIAQLLAVVIVIAVVVYSLALSRGAWRGWTLLAVAVVVEVALLLATRVQVVGVEAVAAEYRYFTDLALVTAMAIGFSFLAVIAPSRRDVPAVLDEPPVAMPFNPQLADLHQPTLAVIATAGIVVGSAASAASYRDRWSTNPGKPYFANAQSDLRARGDSDVLYDAPVPTAVVWRLLWPATLPSKLFAPTGIEPRTLKDGESTSDLVDLGFDGHLRSSGVEGIAAVDPPDSCGWEVGDEPVTIELDNEAFYWNWIVELRYETTRDAVVELTAGETTADVPLPADRDVAYVAVTGELDSVEVHATEGSACITSLVVGLPQPVEW